MAIVVLLWNGATELWRLFACFRKLNREVCQSSSRLMEHLTQRRSQFELSHTPVTLPEACHYGCYRHSKHVHAGRLESHKHFFNRMKGNLFDNFTKH